MVQLPEIKRQTRSNARRLRLRIRAEGIFLTLPPKVSEQKVQQFLTASQSWIEEHWQKLQLLMPEQNNVQVSDGELIIFPALGKQWRICLNSEPAKKIVQQDQQLLVPRQHAEKHIKQWVLQQAKLFLPNRLAALAAAHDFKYEQCKVRHAKSRWGSCSSQGVINLNAALLLVPSELLDYVLLHELCHTRQMNHSDKFWMEMQQVDANFKQHRQRLMQLRLSAWWYQV